ncbi:putative oxidoreductase,short chain dehydrogenase [Xylaria sp. FL1042]|nr:putative oxidoreductase,short chain dehydrogenase [Xylaria sp. FL1042]
MILQGAEASLCLGIHVPLNIVFIATLQDLKKGQSACESFLESGRSSQLNVLIYNAAVMNIPTPEQTAQGFEMQLAINYLEHFLLFWLLKDAMLKASRATGSCSRLVNVSSSGHYASEIVFDDFQLNHRYDPAKAYEQSKLAQIYMANYVDRTFSPSGIHALSLMPGGIATNPQKHMPLEVRERWKTNPMIWNFMKSPEQGAATTILAAIGKEWDGKGGKYLEDCQVAALQPLIPGVKGVKEYAYDEGKENKLWEITLQTLRLS